MTNAPTTNPVTLLLNPREAARALSVSPRTLWSLTACGAVPCVRINRSVRYDLADLRTYVDSLKVKSPAEA